MTDASSIVFVGSDHGGIELKKKVLAVIPEQFRFVKFEDLGCYDDTSVHYPEFAAKVAEKVSAGQGRGMLFCGSGIGVAIAANKFPNVRAATVWDLTSARLSREHNDSNIVCVGGRLIQAELAIDICKTWLSTDFEGGRHEVRVKMISDLEKGARGGSS